MVEAWLGSAWLIGLIDWPGSTSNVRQGVIPVMEENSSATIAMVFVEHCGDVPLATVTRATASDFLAKVAAAGGLTNRTVNNYATTLASVFKSARHRGRFTGDNPFEGQKRKAGGESYEAFEAAEIQTLFESLPLEIEPAKHTPETALPWVSLIAAFTGMRLEEIAQLSTADIREQSANGSTVTVIDIHNGSNNALKNAASARLCPASQRTVPRGPAELSRLAPGGAAVPWPSAARQQRQQDRRPRRGNLP
jgi:integrase